MSGTATPPAAGKSGAPASTTRRGDDYERIERAVGDLQAPFALVDLDAMWPNAGSMLARAAGKPIRVASKSVRCRPLLRAILERDPGFRGIMSFTAREMLFLAGHGFEDLLLAYPTTDRPAIAELAALESTRPVLMVDSVEHLDLIETAAGSPTQPVRVCIELDMGFWPARGRLKIGPKRSPIRSPEQAAALAREIVSRPGLELAGLMGYEGHVAGLGDRPPGQRLKGTVIQAMQKASMNEIRERRAAVVEALRAVAPLDFVNGGGTGSLEKTASEPAVTEVTAGSGFYAPTLFDAYASFELRPAAMFALPVVRRPSRGIATALGGGYLASGPGEPSRLPQPHLPAGLKLDRFEGAGEVQTPLLGEPAARLSIGDRVYLRHAKAGELCERFNSLHLIEGDRVVDEVPTYRGESGCFL